MDDLDQALREEPAGARLRAMCAVAMSWRGYKMDQICNTIEEFGADAIEWPDVPGDWSAAGPALEWLHPKQGQAWLGSWHDGWQCTVRDEKHVLDITVYADTAPLAIARAVCLVGLRERPDEMRAAWESLTRGAGSTEQNQEADHD